jgi:Questin oxidase-like
MAHSLAIDPLGIRIERGYACWPNRGRAMRVPSYTSYDEALQSLAGYGLELTNGNFNHAPMVAEALCAMGRPEAVLPWIGRYRGRMLPRSAAADRIIQEDWRNALGERHRFADWAEFFVEELNEASSREVLDRWVARLAPGFSAAATHGVIRVGHAVRSLAEAETPCRLRELADALASWAATYQELPADREVVTATMRPRDAVSQIPVIPPERRRKLGNITASLAMLDDFHEFRPVIGLIDVDRDLGALLAELTEVFTRVYLANARDVLTTIVFIHGVTSIAALGSVIPEVSDATARSALRYGWQAACGLYACFGTGTATSPGFEAREMDENGLVDRALANGDEHVIKFTEACLRRHAVSSSPAYLAAVAATLGMMPRR